MRSFRQTVWSISVSLGLLFVSLYVLSLFSVVRAVVDTSNELLVDILLSVVGFGAVGVAYSFSSVQKLVTPQFGMPEPRDVVRILIGVAGIVVVQAGVTRVFRAVGVSSVGGTTPPLESVSPSLVPALWILLIAVVPLAEELFFRGVVQRRVAWSGGTVIGVVVSSVLFGVVHLPTGAGLPLQAAFPVVQAFVSGAILGILYEWTDNLSVTVVTHGLFNAVTVVVGSVG